MKVKNNFKKNLILNNKKLILYTIVLTILLLSVGYSAFSSDLNISGILAEVRLEKNIRITGISALSGESDGKSTYVNYNISSIEAGIQLPNQDSSVTLNVTITNVASAKAGILEITGLPDNIDYELLNYNLKEKICDENGKCNLWASKDIQIKLKYKTDGYNSNTTNYNILANFNFKQIYDVKYTDIENNGYPEEVMDTSTLVVNFKEDIPSYLAVKIDGKETNDYTFVAGVLTIPEVFGDVEIIKDEKRGILETLKNEAILFATGNALQKNSIQISNFNSSIDKEKFEQYDLYNKYLTIVPNNETYDVYLGEASIVTTNNKTIEGLLDIIDYKIYGNTLQEGDPSPALPSEIKSVGDKSVNLFDGEWKPDRWSTTNGFNTSDTKSIQFKNPLILEPNTSYYISLPKGRNYYGALFNESKLVPNDEAFDGEWKSLGLKSGSFSFSTTDTLYVFSLFQYNNTEIPLNVQLEKGDHPTEYIPYGKYKIKVELGKNIFNKKAYTAFKVMMNQTRLVENSNYTTIYVSCEPNTTYTISKTLTTNKFKVGFGTSAAKNSTINNFVSNDSGTTITANSGSNYYLFVEIHDAALDTYSVEEIIDKLQIEKGEEATEYEEYVEPTRIYLDEPLRKLDDKIDYIDFLNSKVGRNTKQVILNGTEDWNAISDYEHGILKTFLNLTEEEGSTNLLSSHFRISSSTDEHGLFRVGNDSLIFNYEDETKNFETWLSENNVDVLFPIEQQIDEFIEVPKITLESIASKINVVTEVPPSRIEFTVIQKIQQL